MRGTPFTPSSADAAIQTTAEAVDINAERGAGGTDAARTSADATPLSADSAAQEAAQVRWYLHGVYA